MMKNPESLVGKRAVCSIGRVGLIDGRPWASRDPRVICDSAEEMSNSPGPSEGYTPGRTLE